MHRNFFLIVVFLSLFSSLPPLTNQILLATVYGGLMLGLGTGLVIRFGGCLDGTESVAIVISKKHTISVGQIILIFNFAVFLYAIRRRLNLLD